MSGSGIQFYGNAGDGSQFRSGYGGSEGGSSGSLSNMDLMNNYLDTQFAEIGSMSADLKGELGAEKTGGRQIQTEGKPLDYVGAFLKGALWDGLLGLPFKSPVHFVATVAIVGLSLATGFTLPAAVAGVAALASIAMGGWGLVQNIGKLQAAETKEEKVYLANQMGQNTTQIVSGAGILKFLPKILKFLGVNGNIQGAKGLGKADLLLDAKDKEGMASILQKINPSNWGKLTKEEANAFKDLGKELKAIDPDNMDIMKALKLSFRTAGRAPTITRRNISADNIGPSFDTLRQGFQS